MRAASSIGWSCKAKRASRSTARSERCASARRQTFLSAHSTASKIPAPNYSSSSKSNAAIISAKTTSCASATTTVVKVSLHGHEWSYLGEAPFADAGDEEQVLDAAEGAVAFALCDDARGEGGADAGQAFEFRARRRVDVEARRCVRLALRVRLFSRRLCTTWQLDAGHAQARERVAEGDKQECERACFHRC